jgi:hypothetical protein
MAVFTTLTLLPPIGHRHFAGDDDFVRGTIERCTEVDETIQYRALVFEV